MPCFHPMTGYRARKRNDSGKRSVVFNVREGWRDLDVTLPCGQCVGCRLERSRQWAVRCMHEASLYEDNAFITLTYDEMHLPRGASLDREAFPKFMKRLRRRIDGKVRYFHCGEYGEQTARPHYHALLFGMDFEDKVLWSTRNGFPVWRSVFLESLWKKGSSEIGSVTFESAAYVARYCVKAMTNLSYRKKDRESYLEAVENYYTVLDPDTGELMMKEKEYTTMSRAPGVGKRWFEKFADEVYPSDQVIARGVATKPPRYYDTQHELLDPKEALEVSEARNQKRVHKDETPARLSVREVCTEKRLNVFQREVTE